MASGSGVSPRVWSMLSSGGALLAAAGVGALLYRSFASSSSSTSAAAATTDSVQRLKSPHADGLGDSKSNTHQDAAAVPTPATITLSPTGYYENPTILDGYLLMHYGKPEQQLVHDVGPRHALEFPVRCAQECWVWLQSERPQGPHATRALDVGCAVGRSSFELARWFPEVVALDYSHTFIAAANELKRHGKMKYKIQAEGDIRIPAVAEVDPALDRSRVKFIQGDACALPADLGQFGMVLAANLLCRLPKPRLFLDRLASLVVPGGYVVMPSPYTWLEEFTPKSEWIGGYYASDGSAVSTFSALQGMLGTHFDLVHDKNMPFFIRETARKNQWSVAHLTVWRRKLDSA